MAMLLDFPLPMIRAGKQSVFLAQGIKKNSQPSARTTDLFLKAEEIFAEIANPAGVMASITIPDFEKVFTGNKNNDEDAVVERIYPRADSLALFAFTLGETISSRINELFNKNELPLAVMLDAIASVCAENAAGIAEDRFFLSQKQIAQEDKSTAVLLYSPGYCGWHISGQQALFEYLKPRKIGLTLNKSFLMIPLKSISGVLMAGQREIHYFEPNFPYCQRCHSKSCHARIRDIKNRNKVKIEVE